MRIAKGQVVHIKPEWQDQGDSEITFIAIEDEDGGRVKIAALLGLEINPVQVVNVDMLESGRPSQARPQERILG